VVGSSLKKMRVVGGSQVSFYEHRRAVQIPSWMFAGAVVVSIVHYTEVAPGTT